MIVFRADGNSSVGLGHVMRCLSIADAFKRSGENCLFITADSGLSRIIKERGHKNLVLASEFDHMEDELDDLKKAIESREVDAVIVDSYYVTERYLRGLWHYCAKKYIMLVYIDDILAFPYPCDILLNYNIYANIEDYKKLYSSSSEPTFLLNSDFVPQREEFLNLPDRVVEKDAGNILVSTGGSDPEHIGLQIVKGIIRHNEWNNYHFHLIVGLMNEDREQITALSEGHENITLYPRVKKMAELMQNCDVAISAAGSTLYELCSTQTPTITYILADNQVPGAKGFDEKGVLHCAGDARELGGDVLAERVLKDAVDLAGDLQKRIEIVEIMKRVVDGKGADRVVQAIREEQGLYKFEQLAEFIRNFNIHYSLLLRRYKRFREVNDPHNIDIDVITYLDMILVQLRSICIEHEKYHNNYTAQNLLQRLGRDDLSNKIDSMLEEQFFDYRDGCTIREAIKILTDDYVCHYDSFEKDELGWSELIEKQLRSPFDDHNLDYIMNVLITCIGEGLSLENILHQ